MRKWYAFFPMDAMNYLELWKLESLNFTMRVFKWNAEAISLLKVDALRNI